MTSWSYARYVNADSRWEHTVAYSPSFIDSGGSAFLYSTNLRLELPVWNCPSPDSGLTRLPVEASFTAAATGLPGSERNPVVPPVCGGRWSSSRRATAVVGAPRLVSSETNPTRPEWTEYTVVPQSTFHTSVIRF